MAGHGGMANTQRCSMQRKHGRGDCKGAAVKGSVPPRCRLHLGTTIVKARENEAVVVYTQQAERFATPVPITAADALSADIDRSNGNIPYYEARLREREDNVMRSLLNAERAHAHKLATTALAQKADERRAVIFEAELDVLQGVVERVVSDLGHDPRTENVRAIIENAFSRVVTTPDAVIDADVVDPREAEHDAWADARGMSGPVGYGDDW